MSQQRATPLQIEISGPGNDRRATHPRWSCNSEQCAWCCYQRIMRNKIHSTAEHRRVSAESLGSKHNYRRSEKAPPGTKPGSIGIQKPQVLQRVSLTRESLCSRDRISWLLDAAKLSCPRSRVCRDMPLRSCSPTPYPGANAVPRSQSFQTPAAE